MKQERVIIRVAKQSLSFGITNDKVGAGLDYEQYVVKSGLSIAANLREAFTQSEVLLSAHERAVQKVVVLLESPVLLVPMEEYNSSDESSLYQHAYPGRIHEVVLHQAVAELNCVALFGINKDLRMVITDRFAEVRIYPLLLYVWTHLYHHSLVHRNMRLYAYFHDKRMDLFSFQKSRFRFFNDYDVRDAQDATYFILYVCQQLGFVKRHDELYLIGDIPDDTRDLLHRYLSNVFLLNTQTEFNNAALTQIPGITFDICCLLQS